MQNICSKQQQMIKYILIKSNIKIYYKLQWACKYIYNLKNTFGVNIFFP